MSKKEKFPLYLSPEKKAILERRYQEDGSRSITAFIERAVEQDMVAAGGERSKCAENQWPHLAGAAGAWSLGGGR